MTPLEKKVAVVSGGSSGLGKALASVFLEQNYQVGIIARDPVKLESTVAELQAQPNAQIESFQADVSSVSGVTQISENIQETYGHIDFLVLNAGIVHVKLLEDYDDFDELKSVIETNLWGTVLTARCLVPHVVNGGKILLISSCLGLMGAAGYATYCASKAGVINFAEALRRELISRNITVSVACLTDVDTPQYRHELTQMPHWMVPPFRNNPLQPKAVAKQLVKQCNQSKPFISIGGSIHFYLFCKRILPQWLVRTILDKILPKPN